MPVIVGTGASALTDAITLTRHAFGHGADAVLIMPPFYFKKPSDRGLADWYRRLFDAAVPPGASALLYHIPQATSVPITGGLLDLLLDSHGELVYGVKDSTGDPGQLTFSARPTRSSPTLPGTITRWLKAARTVVRARSLRAPMYSPIGRPRPRRRSGARRPAGCTGPAFRCAQRTRHVPTATGHQGRPRRDRRLARTAVRPPQVELNSAQHTQLREALKELS